MLHPQCLLYGGIQSLKSEGSNKLKNILEQSPPKQIDPVRLVPRAVGHAVQQPRELLDVLMDRAISLLEIPQILFEFLPRAVRKKGPEQYAAKLGPCEKLGP